MKSYVLRCGGMFLVLTNAEMKAQLISYRKMEQVVALPPYFHLLAMTGVEYETEVMLLMTVAVAWQDMFHVLLLGELLECWVRCWVCLDEDKN